MAMQDGRGLGDDIHWQDLGVGHVAALQARLQLGESVKVNLGTY